MRSGLDLAAGIVFAASIVGCGGGDEQQSTQATPVSYPAGFPVSATAPPGATWYRVQGLTAGTTYTASLSVSQPGPNIDLEIYSVFDPTPPNELCTSRSSDTFAESCGFTASGANAYVMLLNQGAIPPSGPFVAGPGDFSFNLLSP